MNAFDPSAYFNGGFGFGMLFGIFGTFACLILFSIGGDK